MSLTSITAASGTRPNANRLKSSLASPRCFNTGALPPSVSTDFTDTAVVATSMFVAELPVLFACQTTGAAVFNGSVVTNGNTKLGLFDSSGNLILATAAVASVGVDSYQRIPWAFEFVSVSGVATAITNRATLAPGTYYLGAFGSSTSDKFNTHTIGNFGAAIVTVVNATALSTTTLSIAVPTTFTTAQGCVGGLY